MSGILYQLSKLEKDNILYSPNKGVEKWLEGSLPQNISIFKYDHTVSYKLLGFAMNFYFLKLPEIAILAFFWSLKLCLRSMRGTKSACLPSMCGASSALLQTKLIKYGRGP